MNPSKSGSNAVQNGFLDDRLDRFEKAEIHQQLFQFLDFKRLRNNKIRVLVDGLGQVAVVIGLGGLGGGLLECLVRSGVGVIHAADGDVFEESNLNRQLLSRLSALGRPKAEIAAERAAAVNPSVEFVARDVFLDRAGMEALLAGAQVAVDALGGLKDRPALAAAATALGIPLVTGAVAGYTAIVATVLPGGPSPADLFGGGSGPSAEDVLGCPSPAVMAVAALQAAEAVRLLAGRPPALAGKALIIDLETMCFDTVAF